MGKESHVSSDVSMGKESHVGQPNIKEAKVPRISSMPAQLEPCIPPMPTQLSLSPRVHGAEIPNPFVSHGHAEGTWKRITRVGLAADSSQPKKRRLIISPARSYESVIMELLWAWEPTYRERACQFDTGKRSLCYIYNRNMGR